MAANTLPERRKPLDRRAKIHRATGQAHRIDCPGRGADDYRKRIGRTGRQQLGNRRQYPHLIGRSRPAAGKNQACDRFGWTHCITPWWGKRRLSTTFFVQLGLARWPALEAAMGPQILLGAFTHCGFDPLIDAQAVDFIALAGEIGQWRVDHQTIAAAVGQTLLVNGTTSALPSLANLLVAVTVAAWMPNSGTKTLCLAP